MNENFEAPLSFPEQHVIPEWVDFNGHMNVAYYMVAFDRCVDVLYNRLLVGPDFIEATGRSVFTLEAHISYLQEVVEGDPLRVTGRLLDFDAKRIHAYFEMFHGTGEHAVAAMEQLGIHVDLGERKPVEFPRRTRELLDAMMTAHRGLPEARYAGRVVGIRRRK
ncbi:MAG TPA: thioesterase family protein [Arenicellales bacterium]|nr:thioesterase family protein [Arenicellales bacterium]